MPQTSKPSARALARQARARRAYRAKNARRIRQYKRDQIDARFCMMPVGMFRLLSDAEKAAVMLDAAQVRTNAQVA